MSTPVARRARLITFGVALVGVTASLLVVPGDAVAEMFVDRAELDDDDGLRVEGEDAVPFAIVRVTSAESSASSPTDDDGRFRVLSLEFRSSNCRATVTDGVTTVQVVLDECTPTTPTTPPTTSHDDDDATAPRPPPHRRPQQQQHTTTTTTTPPPTTTTTTAPPTTTTTTTPTTTTTTTTTVPTDPVTFTDLHDSVPYRCYIAEQSTMSADRVSIAMENGGAVPGTFQRRACIAATTAFNPRSVTDTFTVTVTAPPGQRLTRVTYTQTGNRLLERSTYWRASGTGQLTANGVTMPFSFTHPGLARSIELTGQNVRARRSRSPSR